MEYIKWNERNAWKECIECSGINSMRGIGHMNRTNGIHGMRYVQHYSVLESSFWAEEFPLGGAHPLVVGIEGTLRAVQATLRAREDA